MKMKTRNWTNIVLTIVIAVLVSMTLISCGNETETLVGPKIKQDCSNPSNPNCDQQ
jgi:hypothetical protein